MLLLGVCLAVCFATSTSSPVPQGPGTYYKDINVNLNGTAFQEQLHNLITVHTQLTYAELWVAFKEIDKDSQGCTGGRIGDIYSDICWLAGTQQCGNYKKEGDCYNREHSWPKSWWGGATEGQGAYTDLFHLFPTDGYDNAMRGDFALGTVKSPRYTTSNGCKVGPCTSPGYSGTCWEPAENVKGLFARGYFYMSTAYREMWDCCDTAGTDRALIKPWMEAVLREWHYTFPPDADELERNDLIYSRYQHNRNPFVDFPYWADKIDFTI